MAGGGDPAEFVFLQRMELGGNGLTVAVKDSIDIAGFPTTLGSACLRHSPPAAEHAAVVQSLLAGGCRIVGKTNLHELAFGVTGINRSAGTPRNPRAPGRIPGGSSSGSAVAVALQLVDFALGNDTGGSIRIPAACCGVYGLKPSFGRVSRKGALPARTSLDCVGPLARDVATIERAMTLIDASFHPQPAPAAAAVGWLEIEPAPPLARSVRAALARTGATISPVSLSSWSDAYAAALTLVGAETYAAFGQILECAELGVDVRDRLRSAGKIAPAQVAAAGSIRQRFAAELDAALAGLQALALPTLPDVPLTLEAARDPQRALALSACVRQFNLSGHPALTLPIDVQGLPAALQLIGRRGEDEALCALGRTLAPQLSATRNSASG
jgi:amidase